MADERTNQDEIEVPKKVEQADQTVQPDRPMQADQAEQADGISPDPADEIPVPIAMSPAEIDERAQAVEAVRGNVDPETRVEP